MKMSRNLLRILIMAAGVLILVLVIMYAKPSLDDQRNALELTNQQLTAKLTEIQQLEDNLASYRTQTEEFEAQKHTDQIEEHELETGYRQGGPQHN